MKNLTTTFFLISIFVVLFISCSNDKEYKGKNFIKLVETTENGVSENSVFKYFKNQIISAENSKQKIDYTYKDGFIIKILSYDKINQISSLLEYSYNNKKLVKVLSSENYVIFYVHNSDGTVTYEKYRGTFKQSEQKELHGVLYFKNENLIKDECFYDMVDEGKVVTSKITYEYDSFNNPYYSILGYDKLLDKASATSKNNVIMTVAETKIIEGDQTISSAKMYTTTYKYDADNYPTEQLAESSLNNPNYSKIQYMY